MITEIINLLTFFSFMNNCQREKQGMLQQYQELQEQYPAYILMIRVGSFYEFFFQDAVKVSDILGIKLRHIFRYNQEFYSCGFPAKSLEKFLPLLLEKKLLIAQCEEDAEEQNNKKLKKKRYVFRLFQPRSLEYKKLNSYGGLISSKPVSYEGSAYSPVLKARMRKTILL